ncbi:MULTISPECIES: hypothetical protein [Stenotrophomonas]|uniref:hypothetical protein n=1 Tax=Stenotrophomonas TaxID=40323 RepID=UPI00076FDF52|nr:MULTISPECIES: hypothetical protein [Stenotrophomonas]AMJ55242.1 hypothetical protein AXG53_00275 [Stenotrophomonas sp. KCTC 12332]
MLVRYYINLQNPSLARGLDPDFSFSANGAEEFAAQLQAALSHPDFFNRWRKTQVDPDRIDPLLAKIDPDARVFGAQQDLSINLVAVTSIPGAVLKQRMDLLAGSAWALMDVAG